MDNLKQLSVWTIILGVGVILGIVGSVFLVEDRIEKRIDEKLKNPETIREIASLVRPTITFNHQGTIITDSGAGQFIEDIKVTMGKDEPKTILITPSKHLNTPPVLEGINYDFSVSVKRANKSDWLYELTSPNYLIMGKMTTEYIFRLEIIL